MRKIRMGVVVVSDKAARGEREDRCVEAIKKVLPPAEAGVVESMVVPDEIEEIQAAVKLLIDERGLELVVTTGGTGLGPRDVTPEALLPLLDKEIPGFPELMRAKGFEKTPTAVLSRSIAGVRGTSLLIALPGSPEGAAESLEVLWPAIPHAVEVARGEAAECARRRV